MRIASLPAPESQKGQSMEAAGGLFPVEEAEKRPIRLIDAAACESIGRYRAVRDTPSLHGEIRGRIALPNEACAPLESKLDNAHFAISIKGGIWIPLGRPY